jgi:hypothetical protein
MQQTHGFESSRKCRVNEFSNSSIARNHIHQRRSELFQFPRGSNNRAHVRLHMTQGETKISPRRVRTINASECLQKAFKNLSPSAQIPTNFSNTALTRTRTFTAVIATASS